jgi:hypothetical protein
MKNYAEQICIMVEKLINERGCDKPDVKVELDLWKSIAHNLDKKTQKKILDSLKKEYEDIGKIGKPDTPARE